MNAKQQFGGILLLIAGGTCVWSYQRVFGLFGQLMAWQPPFNSYQIWTFVGFLAAALFAVAGFRLITPQAAAAKSS